MHKDALLALREFLATEREKSKKNMIKNAFYFILKPLCSKFLSLAFGHVEKRLD